LPIASIRRRLSALETLGLWLHAPNFPPFTSAEVAEIAGRIQAGARLDRIEVGRLEKQSPIIDGELLMTCHRGHVFVKRYTWVSIWRWFDIGWPTSWMCMPLRDSASREIEHCRREIAAIEALILAGHRDLAGLCLALSDWSGELRILESREAGAEDAEGPTENRQIGTGARPV